MKAQQEELRTRLLAMGFDEVRFARLEKTTGDGLRNWLAGGMHADMHWMERSADKRIDPGLVLPGAKAAVLLGVNYCPDDATEAVVSETGRPRWARYSLYRDYHDTIKPALVEAGRLLEALCGATPTDYRYYVDTGPVMERGWSARAGLGFVGKNGMLISRRFGNWLFLSAILTKIEFAPDEPLRPDKGAGEDVGALCGKCTRCIEACPTDAIVAPGVVDARRCISYHTIENKGIIPRELRGGIGDHVYGCDVCLEVCPWNRFAQESRRVLLHARYDVAALSLRDLLTLTPERFGELFRGTAIKRVKHAGLLRNACVVAANTRAVNCLDELVRLAAHESEVVRVHAVWAVFQLVGKKQASELLRQAQATEFAAAVLDEYSFQETATDNPEGSTL